MILRVMSDLHLEFLQYKQPELIKRICETVQSNETLVLCGDVCSHTNQLVNALRAFCRNFDHVVFVCGNHEFYGNRREHVFEKLNNFAGHTKNFHLLENRVVTINDQRILGTTLWFRDDPMNQLYEQGMNDFWTIPGFRTWNYAAAEQANKFLTENLQPHDIVVTHHLPANQLVANEYKTSQLNRFFTHDCSHLITTFMPKLWLFGHTHTSVDTTLYETRCVANPRGYPRDHALDKTENRLYNPIMRIEV